MGGCVDSGSGHSCLCVDLLGGRSRLENSSSLTRGEQKEEEEGGVVVEGQLRPLCSMRRVRPVLKRQFPAFQ